MARDVPWLVVVAALLVGCSEGCSPDPAEPWPTVPPRPTVPELAPPEPWERDEVVSPGSVTFNEIRYGVDDGWVELRNPMAIDLDVSGWQLTGTVAYTFPQGTVVAAGGLVVVAADPATVPGALGPWTGRLPELGERLELRNNGGRRIDSIAYRDDEPWPVGADGSGHSLAKVDPDAASDHAEHWVASPRTGGTPGAPNLLDPSAPPIRVELVPLEGTWTYDLSGAPAGDWTQPGYDDSAWPSGDAVFFAGGVAPDALATVRATADNHHALYLGEADATNLRWIGQDLDADWTTVESFDAVTTARDHLYVAAWEAPGYDGGPQMAIAELEVAGDVIGTNAADFEWILGPVGGAFGVMPPAPPPSEATLAALVVAANASGTWSAPGAELPPTSDPWGGAVGFAFDAQTQFVWADTFDAYSVTNLDETWVLFRSTAAVLGDAGATELASFGTTTVFRTTFTFEGDPAAVDLSLAYRVDDGAVFYLNGVEIWRDNLPVGPIDAATLASAPVAGAVERYAELPADALLPGLNALTVEVHQAEPDDADLTFGCSLTAELRAATGQRTVVIDEVAAGGDSAFWLDLLGVAPGAVDLDGLVVASSTGGEFVLPAGTLSPGAYLTVGLDFPVVAGDVLFLYTADRASLLDAVRVQERVRDHDVDGGSWGYPPAPTPGAGNDLERVSDVVINEIQYHQAPLSVDGMPVVPRQEEWIELFNRGDVAVDLTGWQLVDGVAYVFPEDTTLEPGAYLVVADDAATFALDHPGVPVVGDVSGRLANGGERVLLLDARGNPADEVRYVDGGRWPTAADGGGSTLELRDPWADNSVAEAWAASDESARSTWASYSYRGIAQPSAVGPDGTWNELILGLLDAGEVLVDDVSVVLNPDGNAQQLVRDGGFDDGGASWRLLGNHRHAEVVPDPDDGSNAVLRLVATGPTGHMHNHAETTLAQPLGVQDVEVSFRARWVSGSNQLNSRLYFNRLPVTTLVAQPPLSGTPGAPNTAWVANLGPTFADLRHDAPVPAPAEPVTLSVAVSDPDGVAAVTVWSSVAGAPFVDLPMSEVDDGRWEAELAGQPASTLVQFYVEAEDTRGARSTFPAGGSDSRALYRVDDGQAATHGLHNFRILLTSADSDWLHTDVNLMSDDLVGGTVIYDESRVFYDVGVRLKGSERGRPEVPRLGYGVSFGPDQPFRGSHTSVLIDRSEGIGYGQREVLINLVMTAAGSVSGEYNDLVQALTPLPEHTGPAELQLDRFSNLVLEAQFDQGGEGRLFEYELIYYPLLTDDGTPEGLKLPQPDSVVGTPITDLGLNPEAWRWIFLPQNNEREDDLTGIQALGRTFALPAQDFLTEAELVLDVDQWLRAFAFATLAGAVDNYGGDGAQHNAQFYVRPDDQRVLYFPHDLDFYWSSELPVVPNGDLERLLGHPAHLRAYYGHLADIVERSYNPAYLAPWCAQLGALLPGQDFAGHCAFVADRADYVMNRAPDAVLARFPPVDFEITTAGGADFGVAGTEVVIDGRAWVDVRDIAVDGVVVPVTWVDARSWQVTVTLAPGANALSFVATDLRGEVVGSDAVVVTSEP